MRHPAAQAVSTILFTILFIIIIYVAVVYPKDHHEGHPAPQMDSFEIRFEDSGQPAKTDEDEGLSSPVCSPTEIIINQGEDTIIDADAAGQVSYSHTKSYNGGTTYSLKTPISGTAKDWDHPLFEIEVSSCYISCEITTIQPAPRYGTKEPACLLVLQFTFHPALSHRFKNARLSCTFKPIDPEASKDDAPVVAYHAPRTAYGGYSKTESHWTYGLSAPLQAPGGYFSITPSAERSRDRIVDHYMRIEGSARGTPRSKCVWTMGENEESKAGLPLDFQVAVVLQATRPFRLEVDIAAEIARWWKSKSVEGMAVDPRIVDPMVPRGKQFAVGEDLEDLGLGKWWSGQVDGAIMEWDAAIPRT
ncbi:hypothetical protein K432DRAFT_385156 [Lepidopterella palustris CBS 459.81]|uniref:Uncharacterized protein n=1 Tax=Lepidopterella palustris CBS 459.81 TaxID=1314670 RepID=A0A8E2JC04_9PEZI|nr:hypothetical protein K432DRAFT_385156 [Lepidopterella palustris CBS 459.81]